MWRESNAPVSDELLVEPVEGGHVGVGNDEAVHAGVFDEALAPRALGQGDHAVLQRPADEQLRGRHLILGRQLDDSRVPHAHRPGQRGIRLDDDAVARAAGTDGRLRVERVHLDLVDDGGDAGLRRDELLDL